jgi:hypothetical protein
MSNFIVKDLNLEHFGKYVKLKINYNHNVTYLIGPNGSSKTTLGLTAIWFILQGIAEKSQNGSMPLIGERFRFIHKDFTTAKGILTLVDTSINEEVTITRKLSKDKNTLEIVSSTGRKLDQDWLNALFNAFMLSPKRFYTLTPAEQTKALGIDVNEFNEKEKELKTEFTHINRNIKEIGAVPEFPYPIIESKFKELQSELTETIRFNNDALSKNNQQEYDKKQSINKLNQICKDIQTIESQIEKLKQQLVEYTLEKTKIESAIEEYDLIPIIEYKDTFDLEQQIKKEFENQNVINTHRAVNEKIQLKQKLELDLINNKSEQQKVIDRKNEYLKSLDFNVKGLEINENGELVYQERFIREPYFSTGELIRIVIALNAKMISKKKDADVLKYVFIQDWELLDKENQVKIQELLIKLGFQIVIEHVGTEKVDGEYCLILNEIIDA